MPRVGDDDPRKLLLEEGVGVGGRLRHAIEEITERRHAGDACVTEVGHHADGALPDERRRCVARIPVFRHDVGEGAARGSQDFERCLCARETVIDCRNDGLQLSDAIFEGHDEVARVRAGLE